MKGIILAGGTGSRLSPLTKVVNKHLLQVYDKPMIYYPLSILMLAGIREILIICNRTDLPLFKTLLGDGARLGLSLEFEIQDSPGGIVEAFIIGERFINNDNVALILGDNMFIGEGFPNSLRKSVNQLIGGTIYGYKVSDPKAFGVIEFEDNGLVKSIEEKPNCPKSNYAITGLYFYDQNVCYYAKNIERSARSELEISSLNNVYLMEKKLNVEVLGRTFIWKDMGNFNDLLEASNIVKNLQENQGFMVACIEEIAFNQKWIDEETLVQCISFYKNTAYETYLKSLI